MREVVIVSAARTPVGSFGGALSSLSPAQIGTFAAKEAIKRAGITPDKIDEVIIGCILTAGHGQNIARQVSLNSGIPDSVPAMTINKVCGSGLRAVSLAAQIIKAGDADVILAGGTESMTNAAYALMKHRAGNKMGNDTLIDTMISEGLSDVFNNYHMGITAENLAEKFNITREEQDSYSASSQQKAETAIKEGKFKDEIASVTISSRKGDIVFDTDEYPKFGTNADVLAKLKPAFKKDGTVTAGNASGINDGAAFVLVMSKAKCEELGLEYMAEIIGYGSAGVDPSIMGYGPVPAVRNALNNAKIDISDLDLIEANEAFAVQSLTVAKELGFDAEKTNVNGGAIAIGHPIGASGTRILTSLLYEMKRRDSKYGLATLCIGGGMGTALVVKKQ